MISDVFMKFFNIFNAKIKKTPPNFKWIEIHDFYQIIHIVNDMSNL